MTDQAQTRMTAAEFAQLPETNIPTELINGEIVVSPSPEAIHQRIARRLVRLLEDLITEGELFFAPMDVNLDEYNTVQPDIFWIGPDSACHIVSGYPYGPPDLVIEILSPGTARYDKSRKFRLYERSGVREYWLVEPRAAYIEVWRREDDAFQFQDAFGPDATFTSIVSASQMVKVQGVFDP